jgi:hypothetical protein
MINVQWFLTYMQFNIVIILTHFIVI